MTIEEKVILSAIAKLPKNEMAFGVLKRLLAKQSKNDKQLSSKTELLSAYHSLLNKKRIARNRPLEKMLTRRAVRTLSGVTIVTSLVKPYPCPGQCVYCPLDERMPKSYLSEEPAAMRALTLKFDPFEQMAKRIEALENNGHPTDKIELIIKGGTWNSYPLQYQYWFVLESYRGANEVGARVGAYRHTPRSTRANINSPLHDAIGYTICYQNPEILHYCYPFYNIQYPISNIGMAMMLKAIVWAKEQNKKYFYLGSFQRPTDTYKLQFTGLEWWDGKEWKSNLEELKNTL